MPEANTRAARTDHDVLVVGLGPVGATLATLLSASGISVLAIDEQIAVYPMPRAVHFDHEIMRLFQHMKVVDHILPNAQLLPRYEFRAADGRLLFGLDPNPDAACGWASGYMFHQPSLERALRDRLADSPSARIELGTRFESLIQDDDGVTVSLSTADGVRDVRVRYVVACDGGRSPVREHVGGTLFDYGFDEPWLVIDATIADDTILPVENIQICDPARPISCVHSGPGRHRWEFMLLPGETAQEALSDAFIRSLLTPWGSEGIEIERRAVYHFHGLVAQQWRFDRVLLAGDSAHQMPPFAGQGLCSGLRDAANLAWKLAAVIRGDAQDALLDTYQPERDPHVRTYIELAINMGRVVCTLDRDKAAARDAALFARAASGAAALPMGRPARLASACVLPGEGSVGDLFPQPVAGTTAARVRLDDVLGDAAWLITRVPTDVDLPVGSVHHLSDPDIAPFRDALGAWLDDHGVEAVLVRPDRYVFGLGEPNMLATAWREMLKRDRPAA